MSHLSRKLLLPDLIEDDELPGGIEMLGDDKVVVEQHHLPGGE